TDIEFVVLAEPHVLAIVEVMCLEKRPAHDGFQEAQFAPRRPAPGHIAENEGLEVERARARRETGRLAGKIGLIHKGDVVGNEIPGPAGEQLPETAGKEEIVRVEDGDQRRAGTGDCVIAGRRWTTIVLEADDVEPAAPVVCGGSRERRAISR